MLDQTLIVWTGEFGRTSYDQDISVGRRRSGNLWPWPQPPGLFRLAGRWRCEERTHATATRTNSASARVDGKVHLHDLHATMLHLLGLDHEAAQLPAQGPRLSAHRCRRPRCAGDACLTSAPRQVAVPAVFPGSNSRKLSTDPFVKQQPVP